MKKEKGTFGGILAFAGQKSSGYIASVTAGFKLALGIIGELGASYSFDADELTANEVDTHG